MKKIKTADSIICENRDSIFNYFAWPSVAKLPDGTLAMAASGYRLGHICPFGKAVICYSCDGGKSWTRPAAVIDTPLDDRDAGLSVFGNNVIFTSFNNSIEQQRRWNSGKSKLIDAYLDSVDEVSAEEEYLGSTFRVSADGGYTFGKIMHAPVSAPHGMCVLPGGGILYIGRPGNYGKRSKILFSGYDRIECHRMTENFGFEYMSCIENVSIDGRAVLSCEPFAFALDDMNIIVHIRVQAGNNDDIFTILQSESHDGGMTWSKPHTIGLPHGSPAHIIRHSSGVLVSVYGYRLKPYGERVMFSTDGGKSWLCDYILRDDGPDIELGYPCSVELPDGKILTVYYQHEAEEKTAVIMQSVWEIPREILAKL